MKSSAYLIITCLLGSSAVAQTVVLDNFNAGTVTGAVRAGTSWDGQVTQDATTITVGGTATDENGWAASYGVPLDLSAMNFINVTAQLGADNVAPTLAIEFLDSSLESQIFTVATSSFLITGQTMVSIAISDWGTVNPADISEWSIGGGGAGTIAFRMTFDELSVSTTAVPEPSTYAALAGLVALGFGLIRRRAKNTPVAGCGHR